MPKKNEQAIRAAIAERLNSHLVDKHITQGQLAQKIGISRPVLSLYLWRKRTPPVFVLQRIVKVLQLESIDALISGNKSFHS